MSSEAALCRSACETMRNLTEDLSSYPDLPRQGTELNGEWRVKKLDDPQEGALRFFFGRTATGFMVTYKRSVLPGDRLIDSTFLTPLSGNKRRIPSWSSEVLHNIYELDADIRDSLHLPYPTASADYEERIQ